MEPGNFVGMNRNFLRHLADPQYNNKEMYLQSLNVLCIQLDNIQSFPFRKKHTCGSKNEITLSSKRIQTMLNQEKGFDVKKAGFLVRKAE